MKVIFQYLFSLRKKKLVSSGSLSSIAWKKFKKNKVAMAALFFILISILIAALGYTITPDSSPLANQQFLELSTLKQGNRVDMLYVKKNERPAESGLFRTMFYGRKSPYQKIPFSDFHFEGGFIKIEEYADSTIPDLQTYIFSLPDVVYALDPEAGINIKNEKAFFKTIDGKTQEVTLESLRKKIREDHIKQKTFVLGTDRFGRDMLSRLMIGTRVSLSVGFISVLISLLIGLSLGAIAGYFRGFIDDVIVWFINVVWSLPTLLLVIAITFALGKGFWQVFIAVGITMWVEVARVVRGQIISIREKEYIEACRALGYSNFRIIFRHILPNVMSPVIVISAANFAAAILIEAGLSFLGIGVQPPMPSWGSMIKEHYAYLVLDSAYLAILPGIAIVLMVLAFMLIGNALREALDVKS